MIFCSGDEAVGIGTTPQGAYDDYKNAYRALGDADPMEWDECDFFEGEKIKVREKKLVVRTTKTELVKVK